MFLGIGHVPNAKMFAGQIDLDDDGYVRTHDNVFTRVPGSLPAATCRTGAIGRRSRRPGSGCMAALEVEKYLEEHGR